MNLKNLKFYLHSEDVLYFLEYCGIPRDLISLLSI